MQTRPITKKLLRMPSSRFLLSVILYCCAVPLWAVEQHATLPDSTYDESWYMGLAYGNMHYNQDNLPEFGVNDYRLILGKQFNRVFAAEVHVGTASDDTQPIFGTPTTLSINNYVAGFVRANLTFTDADWNYNRFRLYGLLGGTRVDATSSDPATTRSGVQSSVSFGAGLEFFFENVAIQLGYTRYVTNTLNDHDFTLDSLHLGFIYQFGGAVENAK